ncbi:MAG: hypothetical protein A2V65_04340 [Deltaproteobacteria bacterium RBG_13_49_15]|nr:MAG: hypothetical protein A2V65_04340 [Deltaproteobacteria bacterium RBG_13_49_15]
MRVLIVDDEEELASTLAERLCLRGIEAEWAGSAKDALKLVETSTFDIAVLDLKMPQVDGLELMRRIRDRQPKTQILFLTGHGSEELFRDVVKQCGESVYLIKPIDIDDLIDNMKSLMECRVDTPPTKNAS